MDQKPVLQYERQTPAKRQSARRRNFLHIGCIVGAGLVAGGFLLTGFAPDNIRDIVVAGGLCFGFASMALKAYGFASDDYWESKGDE